MAERRATRIGFYPVSLCSNQKHLSIAYQAFQYFFLFFFVAINSALSYFFMVTPWGRENRKNRELKPGEGMPKKVKNLTAIEVARINKPGRHAVGTVPGLQLVVKASGAKSWMYRTKIGDLRRSIGLGGYPATTLAKAHEKARNIKSSIESGLDPLEEKRKHREALIKDQMKRLTFAEAARQCHALHLIFYQSIAMFSFFLNGIYAGFNN